MGNNIYHFILSYNDITNEYIRPIRTQQERIHQERIHQETTHTFEPIDPPILELPPQQLLSSIPEERTPMLSHTSSKSSESFSE